jgi:UrcA family protein
MTLTPAFASGQWDPPSTKVSYADLDITRRDGAEILYQRLRDAAGEVCGPAPDIRSIQRLNIWRGCSATAIKAAVTTIDQLSLTQVYLQRTGRERPVLLSSDFGSSHR